MSHMTTLPAHTDLTKATISDRVELVADPDCPWHLTTRQEFEQRREMRRQIEEHMRNTIGMLNDGAGRMIDIPKASATKVSVTDAGTTLTVQEWSEGIMFVDLKNARGESWHFALTGGHTSNTNTYVALKLLMSAMEIDKANGNL